MYNISDIYGKAERKLGPIDIGRALDFDAAEFDYETDEDFLAERLAYRYRQIVKDLERKLGPVEIGRLVGYDVAEFDYDTGWGLGEYIPQYRNKNLNL